MFLRLWFLKWISEWRDGEGKDRSPHSARSTSESSHAGDKAETVEQKSAAEKPQWWEMEKATLCP